MKATIELDDALFRRLKVEAALRGQPLKALVAEGVKHVLENADGGGSSKKPAARSTPPAADAAWFGSLGRYAANAQGDHSLTAMRRSIETGRIAKARR